MFEEDELDNPDTVIDQAHRTGPEFSDQTQNIGEPARKKIRTNVKKYA